MALGAEEIAIEGTEAVGAAVEVEVSRIQLEDGSYFPACMELLCLSWGFSGARCSRVGAVRNGS